MADAKGLIKRSDIYVISCQLEGLCHALRLTVPQGLQPSAGTIALLTRIRHEFRGISAGSTTEVFANITNDLSSVDILAVAETLRATAMAFLTPDEVGEQRQTFGLTPRRDK